MGDSAERALRLLQQVATALSTGGPLEGLPEVTARIAKAYGARRAAVLALPEPRSPRIYMVAASDEPPFLMRLPFELEEYPEIAAVISARRTLVGVAAEPLPDSADSGPLDEPLVALPLCPGGTAVGCLTLRLPRDVILRDDDTAALDTLAQVIAVALRGGGRFLESLKEQTRKVSIDAIEERRRQAAIDGYRDFFDSAADGILVVDAQGVVLHMNRAAEQLTGYARRGVRGRRLFDLVPAQQHSDLADIVAQSAAGQQLAGFDFDVVTTSGEPLRVSASTSAVLAAHGAAVFAFRDVTEARALEDELRKTKDFLLRLLDSAVDGIIASDMDGRVILFNEGAQRVFGWSGEEVLGKVPVWNLYPDGVARAIMEELRAPDSNGRLVATRREVLSKSGERVPVDLAASIVYEGGQEVATLGIFSDLRERLRIERSLADAQEKLLVSEKQAMLAELAGTTAHELNQPLTSVMGYTELLLKRMPESDPSRRAVGIVLREAERMAEIVRKIGKITRYETRPYVGSASILDLEKAAGSGEPR